MIPDEVREALTMYLDAYNYRAKDWGGEWPDLEQAYKTLCEFRDSQPQAPTPDWSQAPEWAMWWAVDATGLCAWWEEEPRLATFGWVCPNVRYKVVMQDITNRRERNCPLGVDWRLLKQRRPEAAE